MKDFSATTARVFYTEDYLGSFTTDTFAPYNEQAGFFVFGTVTHLKHGWYLKGTNFGDRFPGEPVGYFEGLTLDSRQTELLTEYSSLPLTLSSPTATTYATSTLTASPSLAQTNLVPDLIDIEIEAHLPGGHFTRHGWKRNNNVSTIGLCFAYVCVFHSTMCLYDGFTRFANCPLTSHHIDQHWAENPASRICTPTVFRYYFSPIGSYQE